VEADLQLQVVLEMTVLPQFFLPSPQ
jgi:hypothetical protein